MDGTRYTKDWVVHEALKSVLSGGVQPFGNLVTELQKACSQLNQLGIFKEDIDVMIDKAPALDGDDPSVTLVNIKITVEERPRFYIRTGTEVGANEGSVVRLKSISSSSTSL